MTAGWTRVRQLLVVAVAVLATGVTTAVASAVPDGHLARWTHLAAMGPQERAAADVARFFDRFVEPDGRVVRHDQGGDTVSEGQAYAMLAAAGVGARGRFDLVWGWARQHLQRPDGLLAWRWVDGNVVDGSPATDADLDAAWALAVAERRWPGGGYGDEARRIVGAIDQLEVATVGDRRFLAAGPWAVGDPVVANPSYESPVAVDVLASVPGAVTLAYESVAEHLVGDDGLVPDWAHVASDGTVSPADGPDAPGGGRFGWDAVRVPLRHAASCDGDDREVAAEAWRPMHAGAGVDLMGDHPARLTGAAAAAAAAGQEDRADELLDRASASDDATPTYYGSALTAVGRVLLTTDGLGGCPPLA